MEKGSKWMIVVGMVAGFLGGFATNTIFSYAQNQKEPQKPSITVSAQQFNLLDAQGRVSGSWTSCGTGAPCLNLMDQDGKLRLQLGIYSTAGEAGLPFIAMNNERGEVKALVRLFGPNAAPVVVLKNNNQDRMVMGLDLQNSQEPFLATIDGSGNKKMIFGNF